MFVESSMTLSQKLLNTLLFVAVPHVEQQTPLSLHWVCHLLISMSCLSHLIFHNCHVSCDCLDLPGLGMCFLSPQSQQIQALFFTVSLLIDAAVFCFVLDLSTLHALPRSQTTPDMVVEQVAPWCCCCCKVVANTRMQQSQCKSTLKQTIVKCKN